MSRPTGEARLPAEGYTFKTGPRAQPSGHADSGPRGGRIATPNNVDTSPAANAGDPEVQVRVAASQAQRPSTPGAPKKVS